MIGMHSWFITIDCFEGFPVTPAASNVACSAAVGQYALVKSSATGHAVTQAPAPVVKG